MLPWTPRQQGAGEEQVPEAQGPLAGSDPGQAWDSGEEALGEPRTPHRTVFSPGPEGLPGSERAAAALAAPRPGCQVVPRNPSSPLPTDDLGGGPIKDDPAGILEPKL
ncbi:hypothetical protein E2I00_005566 [Balaenoptera physalus]|uniref:Uncharacterized protein n=1 Tax=Balaenoptera physalus TaxID=9770 RepID=A0A643CLQ6_BALPH|nr:hypothetical protein E2I00_005566 [Balaenoptera physalus]